MTEKKEDKARWCFDCDCPHEKEEDEECEKCEEPIA
jgi:hypothetical protein